MINFFKKNFAKGKKSLRICHPEFGSGSYRHQEYSAICTQKSYASQKATSNVRGDLVPKTAFTLAEVLITLGIIGVVAAMTLPTLIAKYQEKVTVTKLKKVYSILSQAYLRAQEDYGTIDNWGFQEDAESTISPDGGWTVNDSFYSNSDTFINVLSKYMNAQTKCVSTNPKCTGYRQGATYFLSGIQSSPASNSKDTSAYIILNDGIVISGAWINRNNPLCTDKKNAYCGNFSVDINGADGPNTLGKDIFYFKINKKGIYPHGGPDDDSTHSFPANCNLTSTANSNGYGCTAWVIHNENMDYLHCDDLSWNGKHKCK